MAIFKASNRLESAIKQSTAFARLTGDYFSGIASCSWPRLDAEGDKEFCLGLVEIAETLSAQLRAALVGIDSSHSPLLAGASQTPN